MVVALWDLVAKAANLAQLLGLDAVTLIAIGLSPFRRVHQANKECTKLEGRVQMLRALLSSVGGRWITQQQQQHDLELQLLDGLLQVTSVLREAEDIVEDCKRSSLYARVRGGRGMATRFRDLRSRVDSCCHLILAINAFLLVVQPPNQNQHHPPSLAIVRTTQGNDDDDVGVPPSPGDSVHTAEPSSTSAAPDYTHVIDILSLQPARNDDD